MSAERIRPPCTIVVLALARIRNEILIFLKIKDRAIYNVIFTGGECCVMRSCICRVRCGTRPIMR